MKWGDAYSRVILMYPWDVVSFVAKGDRLAKPPTMQLEVKKNIQQCLPLPLPALVSPSDC